MFLSLSVVAPVIFVILFLCKDLFAQTNEFPSTPCPDVYQYIRKADKNIGIITINDVSFGMTTLAVELSQHGYMEMANAGKLSLNFNIDKIHEYINSGRPFTYRLDFPLKNVIPRVTSIKINDYEICSGPAFGSPSTNMKLEHTLNVYSSESSLPKKTAGSYNFKQSSRPDFSQGPPPLGSNLPDFLKFSPSFVREMSSNPSSWDQPSYNQPLFTQQPYTQQSYTTHQSYSSGSNLPEFLKFSPSYVRQMTSNPPSPTQPSQIPSFLLMRPPNRQNTISNISPGNDETRYPSTVFTPSTTINPTPRPPIEINIRNPETAPETASTDPATIDYINSICGRENLNSDVKRLNSRGTVISKSRFPWIVAIYKRNEGGDDLDLDFRCGGSLISTRTVVSAAHCFYVGLEAIKPEDIVISMGRHNLTDWADSNNIDANQIILHPDYRPLQTGYDADLGIVRLKTSVTFTTLVKPICMWQGNNDPREIVGISGVIVGWGSDGRQKTTIVPTLINATVVAEITCIRSNFRLVNLTSSRTICAGNLDGSGPCMGDSGNGLMIRNRNKWMLRGTVSAASDTPIRRCVLDDYAIYSDIAMFVEWIRSNMLL